MDKGPNEKSPGRRCDICFLSFEIDVRGRRNRVDVGAEEEEVDDDVDYLEEEAIFPRRFLLGMMVMVRHFGIQVGGGCGVR